MSEDDYRINMIFSVVSKAIAIIVILIALIIIAVCIKTLIF